VNSIDEFKNAATLRTEIFKVRTQRDNAIVEIELLSQEIQNLRDMLKQSRRKNVELETQVGQLLLAISFFKGEKK